MKRLAILILFFLAACDDSGGKAYVDKAPPSPGEALLAKLQEFKIASCQCKDLACAEKVEKDLMA